MQLPDLEFDLEDYRLRIAQAVDRTDTRIFIDTSVMIWLYGLSGTARSEFVAWVSDADRKSRIGIPAWAMHEFLLKVREGRKDIFFPIEEPLKRFDDIRDRIKSAASLLVDDPWATKYAKHKGRDSYVRRLEKSFKFLDIVIQPLRNSGSADFVHKQLFPVFNEVALKSDVFSRLRALQADFAARVEGRVPPGYEDRKKRGSAEPIGGAEHAGGKSGANRFGDLICWTEIIDHCKSEDAKTAIIITHDAKPDWVYLPPRFKDSDGRVKANDGKRRLERVYVASPPLAQEIEVRAGVTQLFVVSLYQLVPVLFGLKHSVAALADAVQLDYAAQQALEASGGIDPVGQDGSELAISKSYPPPAGDIAGEATASVVDVTEAALADKNYSRGADAHIDEIIADLKSHDWYVQNPAVRRALRRLRDAAADKDQVFVLGRNLYQSACGGAYDAQALLSWLEHQLMSLEIDVANLLLAGMLFEAYFGADGTVRSTPKSRELQRLFKVQKEERFRPAFEFLVSKLEAFRSRFLLIPDPALTCRKLIIGLDKSSSPPRLIYVNADTRKLTTFDDTGIETYGDVQQRAVNEQIERAHESLENIYTIKDLRMAVANYFCSPVELLQADQSDDSKLFIENDIFFITWGTNTDVILS